MMTGDPILMFITGVAGSGKSTLSWALTEWLKEQGYSVSRVNLDPGAVTLPYEPDFDVRGLFSLKDVMEEYNLGPNGAQVASADLMAMHIEKVKENIYELGTDYVVIDTPGQIELFAFRTSSTSIVHILGAQNSALVYIVDPMMCSTPRDYVSQIMLAATVRVRFNVPIINVLSKIDLIPVEDQERILNWSDNLDILYDALIGMEGGVDNQMAVEIFRALEAQGINTNLIPTAALDIKGMEDIYVYIQDIFFGGEEPKASRFEEEGEG